jgi:hypothetical protein
MKTRSALLAALGLAGCFGSGGGGDSGNQGNTNGIVVRLPPECPPVDCVCADGFVTSPAGYLGTTSDKCLTPQCDNPCAAHGGSATTEPAPNVFDAPECRAWIERIAALPCATQNLVDLNVGDCAIRDDSCRAATLADLQCKTDTVMFECNADGRGWSYQSSCPPTTELCGASGASGAPGASGAAGVGGNGGAG